MKRYILLVLSLILLFGCSNNDTDEAATTETETNETEATEKADSSEVVQLKYGHYFPVDDIRGQEAEHFAELVNEKSNGTIEIVIYPNSELIDAEDGFQATGSGTVDLFPGLTSYFSGQIPSLEIYNMPFPNVTFTYRDLADFTAEADPIYEEEFTKNNIRNLGMLSGQGGTSLFITEPAFSKEDLKGLNIRSGGGALDKAMKLLGFNPVALSAAELYMALQTGTVDGVATAYSSFDSMNLHEVAPYWLEVKVQSAPYFLTMNLDMWESLSEEQQTAMMEAREETQEWTLSKLESLDEGFYETMMENVDEHHELSVEDWHDWSTDIEPLFDDYLEANGDQGAQLYEIYEKYHLD